MDTSQIWTLIGMGILSLVTGYCLYGLLRALLRDVWHAIRPFVHKFLF